MDDLAKIINQRAIPGTLIFDLDNRLLFINNEALALLPEKNRIFPRKYSFFVNGPRENNLQKNYLKFHIKTVLSSKMKRVFDIRPVPS